MKIIQKLNQIAVYWGTPVADGYGGYTYASPVEIAVRWEGNQELFINDQGQQELSMAVVYSNQDMDINSYLYLGEESELDSSHDDPEIIDGAYRIKMYAKSVNVSGTQYLRKVWLGKRWL